MRYQTRTITDKELLTTFPETKEMIPEKISEWEEAREKIAKEVKRKLTKIKNSDADDFSKWFFREFIKLTNGRSLLDADKHLSRLKRLLFVATRRETKGRITQKKIDRALAVPIVEVAKKQLERFRDYGNRAVSLCPFHREKRPSFTIYKETNSFYCFGCQKGGNIINFIMLLHGFSFPEAVKWLIGEN